MDSYLIEITRDILGFRDEQGQPLVEEILDSAGQKGTGKWTARLPPLEMGVPLTLIGEAVLARFLSALKDERLVASKVLQGPQPEPVDRSEVAALVTDLREALYASKIVSYTQGYMLMRAAAAEYDWNLNYGGIALMWRGGCIVRSVFLGKIKEAFDRDPTLTNLASRPLFRGARSRRPRPRGDGLYREPSHSESPFRPCPAPWRSTTATGASVCPPICCKLSETTSELTPTSASIDPGVSSSTPTGRE